MLMVMSMGRANEKWATVALRIDDHQKLLGLGAPPLRLAITPQVDLELART
jgi:hypothetical protein